MSEDEEKSGGPSLNKGPSMPDLGDDNDDSSGLDVELSSPPSQGETDSGPKGPSSQGGGPSLGSAPAQSDSGSKTGSSSEGPGPKLGGVSDQSDGPSLGTSPSQETTPPTSQTIQPSDAKKPKKKKKKTTVNVHELVRKWGVARRSLRDSLQTLMITEIQTKISMTQVNPLFRRNVFELIQGHLDYLNEMIELIEKGEDELSQDIGEDEEREVKPVAFENIKERVLEEREKVKEAEPIMTDYINEDLKRFKDSRVEPRAAWWVLWYTALQTREIRERREKKFEIVLDVLLRYKPVMRRILGVFLNFVDALMQEFPKYPIQKSRANLIPNPTKTGYNMVAWIKPRYGYFAQKDMEYEEFLKYYARSFGTVSGKAPDFEGGPLKGYRDWIDRSLKELESRMKESNLLTQIAKGDTLEGMLVGLKEELEEVLEIREYDEEGKLMNQPTGGEGAVKFLEWLFETAYKRYETTNIAIQDDTRLSLDMFEFIPDTVSWVNEYGERLVMDWLDPELDDEFEDEDEDIEKDENTTE